MFNASASSEINWRFNHYSNLINCGLVQHLILLLDFIFLMVETDSFGGTANCSNISFTFIDLLND
jgi:hypothetical protein